MQRTSKLLFTRSRRDELGRSEVLQYSRRLLLPLHAKTTPRRRRRHIGKTGRLEAEKSSFFKKPEVYDRVEEIKNNMDEFLKETKIDPRGYGIPGEKCFRV